MKPPTTYFGGKTRLADWVATVLPPHEVYIEPFFGSGALFFAKPRVRHELINDRSGHVVNFFTVLRDRPVDLERACLLTPYARDEFEAADPGEDGIDELERARRWWVLINFSFNAVGFRSGFSVSLRQNTNAARSATSRIGRFTRCAERLSGVTIENKDALEILDVHDDPRVLFYLDPPYLDATRTSFLGHGGRRPHGDYEHEFAAEDDHRRLAERAGACKGLVVVSGYSSPLYDEVFAGWHRTDRRVARYASNGRSTGPVPVTESIWSNRPLLTQGALTLEVSP